MASAFVQDKMDWNGNNAGGGGPLSVTLDATPTEGNLLLVVMCERNAEPDSDNMITSGYTHIRRERLDGANNSERRGYTIYYKFAGASESATIEGTWVNPDDGHSIIYAAEISGVDAYRTSVNMLSDTTDNILVHTGPNITSTAGATLLPLIFWKAQQNEPRGNFTVSWNNGAATAGEIGSLFEYVFATGLGIIDKASAGTYNFTATMTADNTDSRNVMALVLEFNTTTGGPPATQAIPALIGASF